MLFDQMKQYTPPGILAWDNPDASNAFLNGDVAVLEGWASFILPSLDDPDASQVVDKWSVAKYPENGAVTSTQHNFAIFNTSQNVDAAFDYMAYCTGLETLRVLNEFKEESPRKTVWTEPDVLAEQPYLETVVGRRTTSAAPSRPGWHRWLELFVGLAELSAALSEQKSPQDALNDVAANWTTVIAQAPPDWEYRE